MKNYIITTILGLAAVASTAFSALPASFADIQNSLSDAQKVAIVASQMNADATLYTAVKNAGWVFDGLALSPKQIVLAQVLHGDYTEVNELDAAKYLSTWHFKMFVGARVAALGDDTIAAYDWLQAQRLKAVTSAEKSDWLGDLAAQVLAAAKAKQ